MIVKYAVSNVIMFSSVKLSESCKDFTQRSQSSYVCLSLLLRSLVAVVVFALMELYDND